MNDRIIGDLRQSGAAIEATIELCVPEIRRAAEAIIACYRQGRKVLIAGNGGSAADAQHFAGEMVGWFLDKKRGPLPAIALTTDTSVLTAIANDASVEAVFARQVEALAQGGDVFIGLSTSGSSRNVLAAVAAARQAGATTIALCGRPDSPLGQAADIEIAIPADLTPHIQIGHAAVLHCLCRMVDGQ